MRLGLFLSAIMVMLMSAASYGTDLYYRKVFPVINPIEVYGIPVTSYYPKYHYQVNLEDKTEQTLTLSQDDIDKIANKTAEMVIKKLNDALALEPADAGNLNEKVLDVFTRNNCIKCHSGESVKGTFTDGSPIELVKDGKLLDFNREQRDDILIAVEEQKMPLNGTPLSIEDLAVIRQWKKQAGSVLKK